MRGVRAVPAALPDLPGDRRGVGLAARAHRGDAGRALRGPPARRRLHPLHGPVRAVPCVRSRLPVGGAVRPSDGRGARHARPADAATSRGGGGRATACSATTACCWRLRPRSRSPSGLRIVPRRLGLPRLPLRARAARAHRHRRLVVHGCVMDAWMRPTHAAVMRVLTAAGAGVALPGAGARLLRRAARARRPARRRAARSPGG